MSPHTSQFFFFSLFGLASLCAGYTARRRGWVNEDVSRAIHFHTIVWVWSTVLLLSLWRLPPEATNLWLALIQPVMMAVGAYGMIPVAKLLGCKGKQIGVMAIAGGLGNNGFTLGSYLCYSLLKPAEEALAYGLTFVFLTTVSVVPLIFPLARRYGDGDGSDEPFAKLVVRSYLDLRALPMYASLVGIALAVWAVPYPTKVSQWGIVDVLMYVGAFGGYFGIGLRLRLGDSAAYIKQHTTLAMVKFIVLPCVAGVLLWAVCLTPWPLGDLAQRVVWVQSTVPAAIITVMLANLFHLDVRMASVLWVWNTLVFVLVVLPVLFWMWG